MNQSMSIITFNFSDNTSEALDGFAYSCGMPVPSDGIVNNYTDIVNSTCNYCQAVCEAPAVNAFISFWDGFNFHIVGWSYFAILVFIIAFQILRHCILRRKPPTRIEQLRASGLESNDSNQANQQSNRASQGIGNLNKTLETSM